MVSFTKNECNDIINLSNSLEGFRRDKNSSVDPRPVDGITFNYWRIPYNDSTKWIFNIFNQQVKIDTGYTVTKSLDFINMHKYSIGDRFTKHRDIYYPGQILNVGCNLNDGYLGGEFILYDPDQVAGSEVGTLYSFNNKRYHEVKEVKKGERWSLIGFYKLENVDFKGNLL